MRNKGCTESLNNSSKHSGVCDKTDNGTLHALTPRSVDGVKGLHPSLVLEYKQPAKEHHHFLKVLMETV